MPCLILCGHPCSGKTRLAQLIRERALASNSTMIHDVVIINEATACPDQSIAACYATSQAEKATRGALRTAFDRSVGEDSSSSSTLVILDSSNYIKGFRYELHCISKAAGQKHAVVWVLNESRLCREWNQQRQKDASNDEFYSDDLIDELMMRFEPPDARNRWDNPLYRIDVRPDQVKHQSGLAMKALEQSVYNMHKLSDAIDKDNSNITPAQTKTTSSTFKRAGFKKKPPPQAQGETTTNADSPKDATKSTSKEEAKEKAVETKEKTVEEQVDQMLESFLQNVAPLKQGVSTQHQVSSNANVLNDVDSITQQVCSLIATAQNKSTTVGGRLCISLANNTKEPIWFDFNRRIALPELRRLRRQYIQWVGAHPPEDSSERGIAQAFLAYIAAQ